MAQGDNQGLAITLLGKQHMIACPKGKEDELLAAANRLNDELNEFKQRAHTKSDDKVLLMVALNLCHELLSADAQHTKQMNQLIVKLLSAVE
ncbi:cell division protein ZapA [Pseudoalteromonas sp. XMcav1-K]|uniref:cell division protein ZapA n=1 Tax=Pseudoalteromonas sp. XMcav1-K TaxID=3374372 RepID=UPI003757A430